MTTLTEALAEAGAYGELSVRRDKIIRAAKQAGASVTQIADLMQLSRPTVYAVLAEGGHPEAAAAVGAGYAEATGLDVVITAAGGDR